MKYFLLLLLPFSLFASKILSYNIYERSDRADVMITFDTPYTGVIKQSTSRNKIIIKLEDASIESSKIKKVNSDFLHALTITPLEKQTQIVATISPSVRLIASKTADAYGLRLRFTTKKTAKTTQREEATTPNLSALPTKPATELSTSYYVVVGMLLLAIILLFFLKKKLQNASTTQKQDSWLFSPNTQHATPTPQAQAQQHASTDLVSIRFQKIINESNSVVMLDFGEESYLVLMGNSNILLDKFHGNKPSTQQEFEEILQERNEALEDFLGTSQKNSEFIEPKEPLQAYKERASSLYSE